ncbi:hypothetical protein GCM10022243_37840 [Saccharothrix violaceirubra]|uniref:Uncharacterized protein n=1 Tax=Saccharothrix violaceirubra TaxID=413306 RepID=A0A7W7WX66_9PSEU|nr:hypothetical protein [Saccharothrix violaceirubra]MBB4966303.1 hypothetical protein [Saccharothrix violaceirubra]
MNTTTEPDRLPALIAVYQSDRADRATTLNVGLATMGVAATYLVGTIAFYDKLDLLGWAIALLPFPLICVAAFHSQLLNLAAVRARSILTLERRLLADVPDLDRDRVGTTATERATNVHTAPRPHRVAALIAYGGVSAVHLAYIALMLVKAAQHLHGWVAVPAVVYAALLVPVGAAWRHSARALDFDRVP